MQHLGQPLIAVLDESLLELVTWRAAFPNRPLVRR